MVSNGGKIVITQVDSLKKGDGCYRGGMFNAGRMVMLESWPF